MLEALKVIVIVQLCPGKIVELQVVAEIDHAAGVSLVMSVVITPETVVPVFFNSNDREVSTLAIPKL